MSVKRTTLQINTDSCTFSMIDDGDGVFRTEKGSRDRLESKEGNKIKESDPCAKDFLKQFGLESFHGMRVKAFGSFLDVWERAKKTLQRGAADESSAWKLYGELRDIAEKKISSSFVSREWFLMTFMRKAGPAGCYVPLRLAEESARAGDVSTMEVRFSMAGQCKDDQKLDDGSFEKRLSGTKSVGYRTAANMAIADALSMASSGYKTEMNRLISRTLEYAKEVGAEDDYKEGIFKARKRYVRRAISDALSYATSGYETEMRRHLNNAAEVAAQGGLMKECDAGEADVRKAFITKKLEDAKSYASSGYRNEMSRALADGLKVAREKGLDTFFWAGAWKVRKSYVERTLSDAMGYAKSGYLNEMNRSLKNAREVAEEGGIAKDFYWPGAWAVRKTYVERQLSDAMGYATSGYRSEMDKRLKSGEEVAGQDTMVKDIFWPGAWGVRKAYVERELSDAMGYAKSSYLSEMNKRLEHAADVAAKGGMTKEYEAGAIKVRTVYVDGQMAEAEEAIKNGYGTDAERKIGNAETVAKEGKLLDRYLPKILELRLAVKR
jgi:hypothetical protein